MADSKFDQSNCARSGAFVPGPIRTERYAMYCSLSLRSDGTPDALV